MSNHPNKFKKILLAVDETEESNHVARTAHSIGQAFESEMHLVTVIEPLVMAYNDNMFVDFTPMENEMKISAKKHLKKIAHHYHIDETNQHVLIGKPATEIHDLAEKLKADLIVIGTHGRSGLALLLGSTANSVLHGSKCDVLAVRVFPASK
jgi:universal stress protein A